MPALLTSQSTGPIEEVTSWATRAIAVGSDTSRRSACARWPSASSSAASSSHDDRAASTTSTPSLAKRRAIAAPMPRLAPVINAMWAMLRILGSPDRRCQATLPSRDPAALCGPNRKDPMLVGCPDVPSSPKRAGPPPRRLARACCSSRWPSARSRLIHGPGYRRWSPGARPQTVLSQRTSSTGTPASRSAARACWSSKRLESATSRAVRCSESVTTASWTDCANSCASCARPRTVKRAC